VTEQPRRGFAAGRAFRYAGSVEETEAVEMTTRAIQPQIVVGAAGTQASDAEPRSAAARLGEVRQLLRDGEVHRASQLAAWSVVKHPDHPGLRRIHELLNVGRSYRRPATGYDVRDELEWLRDPPEEMRGKWVAVVGRQVVGLAESLKQLMAELPTDLEPTPLVVQVAA